MSDYLVSVLLGIVEGLTEFLPVSSTAHLRLVEYILKIDLASGYWKMYTVVIQVGAILALPVYFWGRIRTFMATFPRGERGDLGMARHPLTLTMVAFAVTAGPAVLLSKIIGKNLESLSVMGSALLIGGAVMWAVDWLCDRPRVDRMEGMGMARAIWIGAAQILSAVFPGTSRSMATIAAGQVAGMSRPAALEFSFFLSMPTMVAATGYELYKMLRGKGDWGTPVQMTAHRWGVLLLGVAVSFVVALAVVAWFMHWVRKRGFTPFAVYRIALGVVVLLIARRMV